MDTLDQIDTAHRRELADLQAEKNFLDAAVELAEWGSSYPRSDEALKPLWLLFLCAYATWDLTR